METLAADNETPQEFSVSDPRVSLLVSDAAIEFDYAANGEPRGFSAVKQLGHLLKAAFNQPSRGGKMYIDTRTVDVIDRALESLGGSTGSATTEELIEEASEVVARMERSNNRREDFEYFREFCVSLGTSLIAYRASLLQYGPIHPNKK